MISRSSSRGRTKTSKSKKKSKARKSSSSFSRGSSVERELAQIKIRDKYAVIPVKAHEPRTVTLKKSHGQSFGMKLGTRVFVQSINPGGVAENNDVILFRMKYYFFKFHSSSVFVSRKTSLGVMQISVRDNIPSNCSDTQSLLRYVSNDDYSSTSGVDVASASPWSDQALFRAFET